MAKSIVVKKKSVGNSEWNDFEKWWAAKDRLEKPTHALKIYDHHPLISPAMHIGNTALAVIDIKTMLYIYTSSNYGEFLGWNADDITNGGVRFAFSRLHPEDQVGAIRFSELINEYFLQLPFEQKSSYRAFWDFRMLRDDGAYVKLLQQDCALKSNTDGSIAELLLSATNIENLISHMHMHLRLTNGTDNLFYKYDLTSKSVVKIELPSIREMEVVRMIAKSLSLKQIADRLGISFNTVKVHSTNILKKLQVSDSLEMINILRVWGFL